MEHHAQQVISRSYGEGNQAGWSYDTATCELKPTPGLTDSSCHRENIKRSNSSSMQTRKPLCWHQMARTIRRKPHAEYGRKTLTVQPFSEAEEILWDSK